MMKLLVMTMCLTLVSVTAWAGGCKKCKKGLMHDMKGLKKMVWLNQERLGVDDATMDQIYEVKVEAKKKVVMLKAEIKALAMDIRYELYKDEVAVPTIKELVDKKYTLKKKKAMVLIQAIADMKKLLTDEQKMELKKIKRECYMNKSGHGRGGKMKCGSCKKK
jgi:hypothetical protein